MNAPSHAEAPPLASERPVYAGVFLVSVAVLLLQISLTRIFSFSIWYHFAYVTISVALLGYGASGAFLAVFPGAAGDTPALRLPLYALVCGLSIALGLVVFARLPFHPFQVRSDPARQILHADLLPGRHNAVSSRGCASPRRSRPLHRVSALS
jgi:hypothetical protein